MTIVRRRKITGAGAKTADDIHGALAPGIVVRMRLRQQRIDAAANEIGHRAPLGGRELLEAARLLLGQLNLCSYKDARRQQAPSTRLRA